MEKQYLFCPKCGSANRSNARFCIRCGANIGLACNVCGHMNYAEASFCIVCGTRLKNQTPIDEAIGQFKKYASWQSMVVTLNVVTEHTLLYIANELQRMTFLPVLIHYTPREISIVSFLECVFQHETLRRFISDRAQKSANQLLEILSRGVNITFTEMRDLLHGYFSEATEANLSILAYCPHIPLSTQGWQFAQDYNGITRGAPVPWLTITQSVLLPLFLGDSRLLTVGSGKITPYLEVIRVERQPITRRIVTSTNRLEGVTFDPLADTASSINTSIFKSPNDHILIYPDRFGKGYIIVCFPPLSGIQVGAHGSSSDEKRSIKDWKNLIPEWRNIPNKAWNSLNDIAREKTLKAFTVRSYRYETTSASIWSRFAFIPFESILYLQIDDSHNYILIV